MKTKENKILTQRKRLCKILDTFNEKELFTIERFTVFLKKNNTENHNLILKLFESTPYETNELNESTIKSIRKSRTEYSKGRLHTLEQIKKEIGF